MRTVSGKTPGPRHSRIGARVLAASAALLVAAAPLAVARSSPSKAAIVALVPTLLVEPSEGPSFTTFRVSGTACVGTNPKAQVSAGDTMSANAIPDGTGAWTATLRVNPLLIAGLYAVHARCFPEDYSIANYTSYPPASFRVTGEPQAGWALSPQTAAADVELILTAEGFGCFGSDASVYVWATGTGDRDFDSSFARAEIRPDASGRWQAVLLLAAQQARSYAVHAECLNAEVPVFYPLLNVVTESRGLVAADPGTVSFTG